MLLRNNRFHYLAIWILVVFLLSACSSDLESPGQGQPVVTEQETASPAPPQGTDQPPDSQVDSLLFQEDFEGGRSYHTGLGHPEGAYDNPWFRQHILGAVWWAATGGKAFE